MERYEKLDLFYLGRTEGAEGEPGDLLLYPSRHLTTHGVIVGMTGSGKTGLGVAILEEAALDGIPAIIVDPKGDLGNLMLTFPDLAPASFARWISEEEVQREGTSREEAAVAVAERWRRGLETWEQGPDRIVRLRQAADFKLFTPGSRAATPISVLSSFAAPAAGVLEDPELLDDRIAATTAGLLGLLGIEADPVRGREQILLANLLQHAWREGRDLDLAGLIRGVQDPPFTRLGVLELEAFYPARDRFELAMAMNGLLASPGFSGWLEGDPLDADHLLFDESGRPRHSIISIAHLSERERMFFVTLLLGELISWMRSRPGASGLRALLYMDEVFGYLPPVAEPPSKRPLLTLLKQARAFGLGLVLATQNPVDLDYKALSNCGTWMIGRLQTKRDRERLLAGLTREEGDRSVLEALVAGLDKREFLLHSVHESAPVRFRTRWVMSYLRGPLTRVEIERLATSASSEPRGDRTSPGEGSDVAVSVPPVLPPDVPVRYLPAPGSGVSRYEPALLGLGAVSFVDGRRGIEHREAVTVLAELPAEGGRVDWERAEPLDEEAARAEEPASGAIWGELPAAAASARSYRSWAKELGDDLYRNRRLELWRSPSLDEISRPGESERSFRIRLREGARSRRDEEVEALRVQYEKKLATLDEKIRRAEQKIEKEQEQLSSKKLEAGLQIGASLLGAFLGRRSFTSSRAASIFGRAGGIQRERGDVSRAREDLERLGEARRSLEAEFDRDVDALDERWDPVLEELETHSVAPRRRDVAVEGVWLAWVPVP